MSPQERRAEPHGVALASTTLDAARVEARPTCFAVKIWRRESFLMSIMPAGQTAGIRSPAGVGED